MLSGKEIIRNTKQTFWQKIFNIKPNIIIDPFDTKCVGPNSVDIHLDNKLYIYTEDVLDAKKDNPVQEIIIPDEGFVLQPGQLYLGRTVEYTETMKLFPKIDGRSSIGRLGILIHLTAGFGDTGYCGTWTLEIVAIKPIRIYPGMRIGQMYFEKVQGKLTNYQDAGHYWHEKGKKGHTASQMFLSENW